VIRFTNLEAQVKNLRDEIRAALDRVLESAQFVLGPEVETFESQFAAFCQAGAAVGVNSGTSALELALQAAGVGEGDEVITVPNTFIATAAAITRVGARPVFVDVDPRTHLLDPAGLDAARSPHTRALLPVHLYGHPADMDALWAFAREHDLAVIEDAAQAHGARYRDRPVGSLGDFGCFSFYPSKNLGAYGEAGAITTRDEARARVLRRLRDWGAEEKFHHVERGSNARMDALQAAILGVKLRHLEAWNAHRRECAHLYDRLLEGSGAGLPVEAPGAHHVYHLYVVRVPDRDAVAEELLAQGIETRVHYPRPLHLQPCYAELGLGPGALPVAERLCGEVLSLPLHAELSTEQVETVAAALRAALARR